MLCRVLILMSLGYECASLELYRRVCNLNWFGLIHISMCKWWRVWRVEFVDIPWNNWGIVSFLVSYHLCIQPVTLYYREWDTLPSPLYWIIECNPIYPFEYLWSSSGVFLLHRFGTWVILMLLVFLTSKGFSWHSDSLPSVRVERSQPLLTSLSVTLYQNWQALRFQRPVRSIFGQ